MKRISFPGLTGFVTSLVVVLAVLLALNGCESKGRKEAGGESVRDTLLNEKESAPKFKLTTLDGAEWSLEENIGVPVVINFWASWCHPCRQEAPTLEKVYKEFKDRGVVFIGVAVQDTEDGAREFVEKYGLTFAAGLDDSGEIGRSYRVFGVPRTFIVGRDGKFSYIHTGDIAEELLVGEIRKVL